MLQLNNGTPIQSSDEVTIESTKVENTTNTLPLYKKDLPKQFCLKKLKTALQKSNASTKEEAKFGSQVLMKKGELVQVTTYLEQNEVIPYEWPNNLVIYHSINARNFTQGWTKNYLTKVKCIHKRTSTNGEMRLNEKGRNNSSDYRLGAKINHST